MHPVLVIVSRPGLTVLASVGHRQASDVLEEWEVFAVTPEEVESELGKNLDSRTYFRLATETFPKQDFLEEGSQLLGRLRPDAMERLRNLSRMFNTLRWGKA